VKGPTLSARLLMPFERALRRAGIDPDGFVRARGLEPDDLRGDRRLPHAVARTLLQDAVTATGDPLLALHAAELVRPGDFDALEYAARATTTLRDTIARCDRYLRLMHDAARLPLRISGARAVLTFEVNGELRTRAENEYVLGVLLVAARMITGLNLRPLEVHLPGSAPEDATEHVRVLTDVIRWECAMPAMVFPSEALDWPLPQPNPRLAAALAEHADRLLTELLAAERTTRHVREQIAIRLPSGSASIDDVADTLKMSTRTLRRRLVAEGTSFSDQVDLVRRELGIEYVERGDRSLTEIAFLLGFSNLSSFHRAFRRWTGRAPSDVRADTRRTS
jgi:AraC-like DNA-binding protein